MTINKVNGYTPWHWLNAPDHHYVGRRIVIRNGKNKGAEWPASPLANKFTPYNSADPIGQYSEWLWRMLRVRTKDNPVIAAMVKLTVDSTLGCWCVNASDDPAKRTGFFESIAEPGRERCHAEVIANVWKVWVMG